MPRRGPVKAREALDRALEYASLYRLTGRLSFAGPADGRRAVALSFDDGPSAENTSRLLDIFAEHRARATFFLVGKRVREHEDLLLRAVADGHEIGNHTYSHPRTVLLTKAELAQELQRADAEIRRIADTRLVRPPYGKDRRRIAQVGAQLGLREVLWSVDSHDTRRIPAPEIVERVLASVSAGAIVLMHDGSWRRQATLDATAVLVPELLRRGFELLTVSELLAPRKDS